MIDVYCFRHPETEWNKKRLFQGRTDIPLNEKGLRQAEEIAVLLDKIRFTHLISSNLRRSLQFAEKVARRQGLDVIINQNLTERSLGIYEGKPYDAHPGGQMQALKLGEFPGGETLEHTYARAAQIPQSLTKYGDFSAIGLFTHGALMARMPDAFKRQPYDPEKITLPPNGGCHYFRLDPEGNLAELRLNYQIK